MAGTEVAEKPILKLKLLVDKEKNRVVFAEAGKDFVHVLFSFLALPMGTIVRLLEKYKQNQMSIGCFNNLYKSVSDLWINDFKTEACRDMILYPEKHFTRLNLININDDAVCDEIFNLSKIHDDTVCGQTSFIITDDMKVEFASDAITNHHDKLEEMFVDVDHNEVLSLLHCLFSSETPLTDVFLRKQSSCGMKRSPDMPTLAMQDGGEAEPNEVVSLTLFVSKLDGKVLYAESTHEFADLLCIFLATPLESVWEITGSNIELGCIDNFCRSVKSLSSSGGTNASMLPPLEYGFQKSLLGERNNFSELSHDSDDGSHEATLDSSGGFVRRYAIYIISDDLTIKAANSTSVSDIVFNLPVAFNKIESHVINISKTQAIGLMRASLMTSTALTTALGGLLSQRSRKNKGETTL